MRAVQKLNESGLHARSSIDDLSSLNQSSSMFRKRKMTVDNTVDHKMPEIANLSESHHPMIVDEASHFDESSIY
jgi:thymidine kinase